MGKGVWRLGRGRLYTYRITLTARMTSVLRWVAMRVIYYYYYYFNVSLIVMDKVTRQCPQTTTFEEKGEPKQRSLCLLT